MSHGNDYTPSESVIRVAGAKTRLMKYIQPFHHAVCWETCNTPRAEHLTAATVVLRGVYSGYGRVKTNNSVGMEGEQ